LFLNLSKPPSREVIWRLVKVSDVVVENFSPRVMEGWGLSYEEARKVRPDIIWVDQPMQGLRGPHKYYAGFGATITPLGGMAYLMGFPGRPPLGTGTNYTDYVINPGHLAISVLGALRYRRRTGQGQHIEMSQFESSVSILETAILEHTANGRIPERLGNRLPYAAPHGLYRCRGEERVVTYLSERGPAPEPKAERWVAIAVFTDAEWRGLGAALGDPAWARDERFATLAGRKAHEDELDRHLEGWTRQRPAEEALFTLQAHGVAAGVVQDAEDTLRHDPQLRARGYYVRLNHPEAGQTAYDGPPFRMSRTPGSLRRHAPLLGEHTEYVCKELLGYTDDEVAQLIVDGVLE
ncbi:MAG: CoA transferase, partial [candidate division NC10 bacterium]|nr:CoA transferase [candidate division NC10 bacterium]